MADLFGYAAVDKLRCAERELDKRREVYPRLIEAKKLSRDAADREIALMQAIVEDYAALAAGDVDMLEICNAGWRLATASGSRPVMTFDTRASVPGRPQPRLLTLQMQVTPYDVNCIIHEGRELLRTLDRAGRLAEPGAETTDYARFAELTRIA